MALVGMQFNDLDYKAEEWSDLANSKKWWKSDLNISYPSTNQITINEGSRLYIADHRIKITSNETLSLPTSAPAGAFYFYIEIDSIAKTYTLKFDTTSPNEGDLSTIYNAVFGVYNHTGGVLTIVFKDLNTNDWVDKKTDQIINGEKTFSEKIVSLKQIIGLWLNPQADAISSNYITFQKTNRTPRVTDNHELLTGRYEKKSYANGVENSNMVMTSVGIYHGNSISANTKLSKDLSNIDRTGMNVGLNSAFTIPGLTQHPFLAGYDHMQIVLSNNDLLTVNLSRDLSIIYLSNTIAFASGENGANMYAYALTHSGTNTFTLTRAYAKSISETTISNLTPPNIASARLVRTGGQ